MGPLINRRQYERVLSYIELGQSEGARLVTGGHRPAAMKSGYFVEPTVFADVDPGSRLAQEEIFGPVLCIIPFEDDNEAVEIANGTIYGLAAQVESASLERAEAIAHRLRAGNVNVNGGLYHAPDSPFGGYKQSGIGREMGVLGFDEYTEVKLLAYGQRERHRSSVNVDLCVADLSRTPSCTGRRESKRARSTLSRRVEINI